MCSPVPLVPLPIPPCVPRSLWCLLGPCSSSAVSYGRYVPLYSHCGACQSWYLALIPMRPLPPCGAVAVVLAGRFACTCSCSFSACTNSPVFIPVVSASAHARMHARARACVCVYSSSSALWIINSPCISFLTPWLCHCHCHLHSFASRFRAIYQ
jgi:hypothetical protein